MKIGSMGRAERLGREIARPNMIGLWSHRTSGGFSEGECGSSTVSSRRGVSS
jgi:hypothetical protein